MTNSREMAQFYVYAIFTLLAIVVLTTLHVLFIAFRKINNPTINPEKKTESSDVGSGEQISSNEGKGSRQIRVTLFCFLSKKISLRQIMNPLMIQL